MTMKKLPLRDSKGRFVSWEEVCRVVNEWIIRRDRLRYMVDKLMCGKWYAEQMGFRHPRNNSGYDYYRNLARLYRSYRMKYGIYECF